MEVNLVPCLVPKHEVPRFRVVARDDVITRSSERIHQSNRVTRLDNDVDVPMRPCLAAEPGIDRPTAVEPHFDAERGGEVQDGAHVRTGHLALAHRSSVRGGD
jgi:hypothetical protein